MPAHAVIRAPLLVLLLGCGAVWGAAPGSETVREVLDSRKDSQAAGAASQARVEALDDETLALIARYNREQARYEDLAAYNENMRALLASQQAERDRLSAELTEIEVVRQAIVPLMLEMVDVLDQFVGLDVPMLPDERNARLAELRANLTRSDVNLAERYRRIIEAYQIEAEYGSSIEAYEGNVEVDGEQLTVDFLRIGRVALYYLSLDRARGGIWDPRDGAWQPLTEAELDRLDYGVRVARRQAPPNLLELPIWTGEAP